MKHEVAERNRWDGGLDALWPVLRKRAYEAKGAWEWVLMWNGTAVAMRVGEDFRKWVRVSRERPVSDPKRWAAAAREGLTAFQAIGSWQQITSLDRPDYPWSGDEVAVTFVELWPNESAVGHIRDADWIDRVHGNWTRA